MGELPPDVTAELRRIGRVLTPETMDAVRGMFTRLHQAAGYQAPRITRDLAYGPDPRHRLDVHRPAADSAGLPVLLYVHGGGFVGGDKTAPGSPYYDHLGGWAARNGLVAMVMTYRLAPVHQWPAGAEDVAAALAWTREHCVSYGADPGRIVLMGQSAGAAHVASFLAGHAGHGAYGMDGAGTVAGAVMLSGIYDPPTAEQNDQVRAYYGKDDRQFTRRSSVPGLVACPVPLLLGVAELDPADFHRQAVTVLDAMLAAHGVIPPFVTIPDHTHQSEIFSLGLDDDAFGTTLARFVRRVTAARSEAGGAAAAPSVSTQRA
jgi:acetyl esterase/lipase